jgi:hypothetical protein
VNHKMSKAEAKAWSDLAEAALRVQRFQNRRKASKGKPKPTKEQRKEAERKRLEFAISCGVQRIAYESDALSRWIEPAKRAVELGLYSKKSYIRDVAGSLCSYYDRFLESQ